jgi:hypothetical protein
LMFRCLVILLLEQLTKAAYHLRKFEIPLSSEMEMRKYKTEGTRKKKPKHSQK